MYNIHGIAVFYSLVKAQPRFVMLNVAAPLPSSTHNQWKLPQFLELALTTPVCLLAEGS